MITMYSVVIYDLSQDIITTFTPQTIYRDYKWHVITVRAQAIKGFKEDTGGSSLHETLSAQRGLPQCPPDYRDWFRISFFSKFSIPTGISNIIFMYKYFPNKNLKTYCYMDSFFENSKGSL